MPYKLSASLHAHSSDVRAVVSPIDTLVLSASRDKTAVAWTRPSPSASFVPESTFTVGTRYVNAVTYIPPSSQSSKGYLVAGGNDTVINVYALDVPSDEPKYSLVGHSENVCTLDASSSGLIISGSWDRTAKVWRDFQEVYELKGHSQSVWAVLIVDEANEIFLTASADTTIKLWQKNKVLRTYSGHTGAVRGLSLIPHIGFASCSNDGEIRVWTTEGDLVYTLSGHTSFVYSLTILPNGDIASSGEDRTVRIWREEECLQTLVHPATSVWAVSSMPNGDIVSGSSDGVVRIFSSAEERWASSEDLKQYDDAVASQALPAQQVGDVKKTDLPGPEALNVEGKKAGEVKMIRNGDNVEAHQWDSASRSWQKIGDVVDAVGSGRKQLYEGKEYDYVFDVDIQDGVPPLKLPYNANENPYTAAQRFLAANELPMSYLDQVVQFIEKNTGGVSLTSSTDYVDPFTGAARYTPSSSSVPAQSTYSDPFTGAGRYVSQAGAGAAPVAGAGPASYADPFTGGTRYTPSGSFSPMPPIQPPPIAHTPTIIPVRTFLSFKQTNVNAMRGKIAEFDEAFQNELSTATLAMYPDETKEFESVFTYLSEAVSTGKPSVPDIKKSQFEAIIQVLERWPASARFPIFDLARLLSGFCPSSYSDPSVAGPSFAALLRASEWNLLSETPLPKSRETNILLTLRALANAFQERTSLADGDWVAAILMELQSAPYGALVKNHRVTLATILFNISCMRLKENVSEAIADSHLSLVTSVLHQERSDAETVYRALVALGNTLFAVKAQGGSVPSALASSIRGDITELRTIFPEDRVKAVVKDIDSLL